MSPPRASPATSAIPNGWRNKPPPIEDDVGGADSEWWESDDDLARLAGDIGTTIFHPVGTCKMGRDDDPLAVTDAHLHLRGVSGVRIADASVMPSITSGNTGSPTLMIAEKAAQWIVEAAAGRDKG